MMQEVRQASILNILHENGSVKIKDLAKQFDVSIVTVRRDLDELAADGLVTKVYGGAVIPSPIPRSLPEHFARRRCITH